MEITVSNWFELRILKNCEVQVCLEVNREWVSYYNGGIQLQSLLLFQINQIRITPSEWIRGERTAVHGVNHINRGQPCKFEFTESKELFDFLILFDFF